MRSKKNLLVILSIVFFISSMIGYESYENYDAVSRSGVVSQVSEEDRESLRRYSITLNDQAVPETVSTRAYSKSQVYFDVGDKVEVLVLKGTENQRSGIPQAKIDTFNGRTPHLSMFLKLFAIFGVPSLLILGYLSYKNKATPKTPPKSFV